jgi:hypothetical protein
MKLDVGWANAGWCPVNAGSLFSHAMTGVTADICNSSGEMSVKRARVPCVLRFSTPTHFYQY